VTRANSGDQHQQSRPQTTEATATDNVGHATTSSCITQVANTTVISGHVKHKLIVKSGEALEVTRRLKPA